jgi:hypothetical protein
MEAAKKPTPMAIITKSSMCYLSRCLADPENFTQRFVMNAEPAGVDADQN